MRTGEPETSIRFLKTPPLPGSVRCVRKTVNAEQEANVAIDMGMAVLGFAKCFSERGVSFGVRGVSGRFHNYCAPLAGKKGGGPRRQRVRVPIFVP